MLLPIYQNKFKKEVEISKKRGKNMQALKEIIQDLLEEKVLPPKNRNHKLKGKYIGYWECHIEPDWLLIYQKTQTKVIIFARIGTHADLFE
jgi:mRNA interferase YafQ